MKLHRLSGLLSSNSKPNGWRRRTSGRPSQRRAVSVLIRLTVVESEAALISDVLQLHKAPVAPVLQPYQLLMTALLLDLAIGQEDDIVRMGNR